MDIDNEITKINEDVPIIQEPINEQEEVPMNEEVQMITQQEDEVPVPGSPREEVPDNQVEDEVANRPEGYLPDIEMGAILDGIVSENTQASYMAEIFNLMCWLRK
jgi:hypothetical protein